MNFQEGFDLSPKLQISSAFEIQQTNPILGVALDSGLEQIIDLDPALGVHSLPPPRYSDADD